MVADALARKLHTEFDREKYQGLVAQAAHAGASVLLVKPLTYMNNSGQCVARALRYNPVSLEELLVIVDDVNLPLGRLRLRADGSAGGHNGLKSIIDSLGADAFARLRIGVGINRNRDLTGHVLGRFEPQEKDAVEDAVARAADAALCFVACDIEKAMTEFNR